MQDVERLIGPYLADVPRLRDRIADMSPEQLRARPVPGRWSTLEVVCHLTDSENVLADRLKRMIAESDPTLPYAHEGPWVERLCCHDREIAEELSILDLTRSQLVRILRAIPSADFSRTGNHTTDGPFTVLSMFQRGVGHLPHHLSFIDEKRTALGLPNVS